MKYESLKSKGLIVSKSNSLKIMKKNQLILFIVFLLLACNSNNISSKTINNTTIKPNISNINNTNMTGTELELNFIKTRRETSKDCNSGTITIKIADGKIKISKEYGGFKAPENEYLEKELTKESEQKIIDFIKKEQLNINLEEHKKTEGMGIAGTLYFEIISPTSSKIDISGKTNIWGTDKYVRKKWGRRYVESRTNIKNIEYFSKANSFIFFITNLE